MGVIRTSLMLLALVAVAAAADVRRRQYMNPSARRTLLQPFTLNLPKLTRFSGSNTGRIREQQLNTLNNAALSQIESKLPCIFYGYETTRVRICQVIAQYSSLSPLGLAFFIA